MCCLAVSGIWYRPPMCSGVAGREREKNVQQKGRGGWPQRVITNAARGNLKPSVEPNAARHPVWKVYLNCPSSRDEILATGETFYVHLYACLGKWYRTMLACQCKVQPDVYQFENRLFDAGLPAQASRDGRVI